jgi:hypothetical protein
LAAIQPLLTTESVSKEAAKQYAETLVFTYPPVSMAGGVSHDQTTYGTPPGKARQAKLDEGEN